MKLIKEDFIDKSAVGNLDLDQISKVIQECDKNGWGMREFQNVLSSISEGVEKGYSFEELLGLIRGNDVDTISDYIYKQHRFVEALEEDNYIYYDYNDNGSPFINFKELWKTANKFNLKTEIKEGKWLPYKNDYANDTWMVIGKKEDLIKFLETYYNKDQIESIYKLKESNNIQEAIEVYNKSNIDNLSSIDINDSEEIGLHVGSKEAANKFKYKNLFKIVLDDVNTYNFDVDLTGMWASPETVRYIDFLSDKEKEQVLSKMREVSGSYDKYKKYSAILRDEFIKRGYKLISYINRVEDPGHTSYIILDPSIIKSSEIIQEAYEEDNLVFNYETDPSSLIDFLYRYNGEQPFKIIDKDNEVVGNISKVDDSYIIKYFGERRDWNGPGYHSRLGSLTKKFKTVNGLIDFIIFYYKLRSRLPKDKWDTTHYTTKRIQQEALTANDLVENIGKEVNMKLLKESSYDNYFYDIWVEYRNAGWDVLDELTDLESAIKEAKEELKNSYDALRVKIYEYDANAGLIPGKSRRKSLVWTGKKEDLKENFEDEQVFSKVTIHFEADGEEFTDKDFWIEDRDITINDTDEIKDEIYSYIKRFKDEDAENGETHSYIANVYGIRNTKDEDNEEEFLFSVESDNLDESLNEKMGIDPEIETSLEQYLQWEGILGYTYQLLDKIDWSYDELDDWLSEEGIYGYTDDIYKILHGQKKYRMPVDESKENKKKILPGDPKEASDIFNKNMGVETSEALTESNNEIELVYNGNNPNEVIDWISEHEQAWNDFIDFFGIEYDSDQRDVTVEDVDIDSVLSWISDHDTLAQDYRNKFMKHLTEDSKKKLSVEEIIEIITPIVNDFAKQHLYDDNVSIQTYKNKDGNTNIHVGLEAGFRTMDKLCDILNAKLEPLTDSYFEPADAGIIETTVFDGPVNIKEALKEIDLSDNDKYYDLRNMYDSINLIKEEKERLATMIAKKVPTLEIYNFLEEKLNKIGE